MEKVLESKLSPEGRASIPAEIRAKLGIEPGDRIQFLINEAGEVRLSTARALAESIWSKNTGGDAIDAGQLVRQIRNADTRIEGIHREDAEMGSDEAELLGILFPAADQ